MTEPYVKQHIQAAIATIEFSHPAHNSLPGDLLEKLAAAIARAGADDRARVVVLRSGGQRTFCAGASFDELAAIAESGNAEHGARFFSGFAALINTMRQCPKFIIARVQGRAVGGGVGLVAAADYALASRHAAVKLSELNIGLGPFVVGPAVERKMGLSAMSQLAIDADSFHDAEWARHKGLYAQVLDSPEALDHAVQALAERLAACNPEAMRELKQALWEDTLHWPRHLAQRAAVSGRLALGDFTVQALAQFKRERAERRRD
ncbi:MAG: enoyl-CoA hydratase/isomerase family protein [Gammaproteobacteria bacterium]|nr:enoyl-CoA hydratase/isomerase family protein [Gammaproteobacteria bacterium]MDD9874827.1 enoyl-CoA hydratase/isomerase family protein [Gammaproteobacteria bacterium]